MELTTPQNPTTKPGVYQGTPPTPAKKETSTQPPARAIRTMKGDIAEAITKQNETAASIALAEAKKLERERVEAFAAKQAAEQARLAAIAAKPKSRVGIIIGIIILVLIVGGAVAGYMYAAANSLIISVPFIGPVQFGKPLPPKPVSNEPAKPIFGPAIITPTSEKRIALSDNTVERVISAISAERTSGLTAGMIKNFYVTENVFPEGSSDIMLPAASNRFLTFMGIEAPHGILRSLDPHFMVGLLGEDGSRADPFIVLRVTDYETSRAGMLQWEQSLSKDFDRLFGTKLTTATYKDTRFRDIIVAGKDARMFGTSPDMGISYAFFDPQTIVITGSRISLEKVLPLLMNKI